jgi:hypothetical protein
VQVGDAVPERIEIAVEFSREVLKEEWERVKRGEPAFNGLRKWMIPSVLAVTSAFVAFILLAKFGN